ncbi:MAG: HAD hydrolase-like protein [Candidatus Omnitrophica bacterium]|nr:HAD hydrolase-like protein [Candidatus Omnitrophota bacterium]
MHVDALLFDLDGTLIDSQQDIATSVNWTLAQLGLPPKSVGEVTYGLNPADTLRAVRPDFLITALGDLRRYVV